ncbi:MAG TPA: hypothetical protein ENF87_00570, partial [Thermoproteales archaeon]|nr:hypothetical protein [Thermoproteales archaeon]
MKKWSLLALAVVLFLAVNVIYLQPQPPKIASSTITLTLNISGISVEKAGNYVKLNITGITGKWKVVYVISTPGSPMIPSVQGIVLLPPTKTISRVSVVKSGVIKYELEEKVLPIPPAFPVAPTKTYSPSKIIYNTSAYSLNTPYPSKDVEYLVLRERGVSYAIVRVYPVKYIPVNNTVKLYTNIRITINLKDVKQSYTFYDLNVLNRVKRSAVYSYTQTSYSSLQPIAVSEGIIILTRDIFVSTLQPLVDLRKRQGFDPVKVVTVEEIVNSGVEGDDIPEKIRNYLYNLYTSSGGVYKYLLIVGDTLDWSSPPPTSLSQLDDWDVPARYFYNPDDYSTYTPCDWYYVTFDSTWDTDGDRVFGENGQDTPDWSPEMAVGRIPVRDTTTLQQIIDKILNYSDIKIVDSVYAGAILFYYVEEGDLYGYGAQGDTRAEALIQKLSSINTLIANSHFIRLYEHFPADTVITNPSQLNGTLNYNNMTTALSENPNLIVWFAHGWYDSAWRKIWYQDYDNDGKVDDNSNEVDWRSFVDITSYSYVSQPCLTVAMSCLTNGYDTDSLGEAAVTNSGGWYLGWDRVTYGTLFTDISAELNPDNWLWADYYTYRFLYHLFSSQDPAYLNPGYAQVSVAIEYVNAHDMKDEGSRRVWMAAALLGDPVQKVYTANMFLELLNQTKITILAGKTFKIVSRVYVGTSTPSSNTRVELQVYENGAWTTLDTSYSDSEGYATFNVVFNTPGNYTLRVVYLGNSSTMPYYGDTFTVEVVEAIRFVLGYPRVATVNALFPIRVHLYYPNGSPMSNARVLLYSETLNTLLGNTTTDNEGFVRFEVTITQLGVHEFNVTYPGDTYPQTSQSFTIEIVDYQVYYIESLPYTINASGLY